MPRHQQRTPAFARSSESRRVHASDARSGRPPTARIDRVLTPASAWASRRQRRPVQRAWCSSQAGVGSMRAQTSASVQEEFSSCAGLGASESTQASDAGGQPGVAGTERSSRIWPGATLVGADRSAGFQCSGMFPRGSGRWGEGLLFAAQLTRIVVSPACDGELPEPVYASAARSVAAAARKRVPPAPWRGSCGPAIVIEMPRRRRDVSNPGPGARPAGAAWAVAQRSPVGAASSAVETGCPAGMASAPPVVCGSIVWASWPPPTCTRRGLAASATGIVSVSTPCS